jgi:hypothetical protein
MSKNPGGFLWKVAIKVRNKLVRCIRQQARGVVCHGVGWSRNVEFCRVVPVVALVEGLSPKEIGRRRGGRG